MKRYPLFDPPEYIDWIPDPEVMREYQETLDRDPQRALIVASLSRAQLLAIYAGMLRFRLHDITLRRWVKQGIISKAWLGTGEEAVTIGNVHALDRKNDLVGPMIRNAGACHEMGIDVADMLRAYLATGDSPSGGKDFHIGKLSTGVVAPTSMVASLVPVVAGIGLSFKQRGERRVVLTWIGDGATKTTASHEGLNLAAVLRIPAIYVLQNNQIALGTRLEQHQGGPFQAWAKAYGVKGFACMGNNVLDVFRMGGHATHDEREAREIFSTEEFGFWGKRDPIGTFETWLEANGIARTDLQAIETTVSEELVRAEESALFSRDNNMPAPESALSGVYAG
jgi:TPP-dependent pyruvate/acetoin dehydrogenase alpha subunit